MIPPGGSWKEVPPEVRQAIEASWDALKDAWDRMYPSNPIGEDDEH